MNRRRRLRLAATGIAVGTSLFAACGFPDVVFAPDDAGTDANGLDVAASADVVTSSDAPNDVATPSDAGDASIVLDADPDVAVAEDAGGKVDAAGCTECDCDHDGYNDPNRPDCGPGPYDCDDNDSRSHPGQIFIDQDAEPPMNGDWNCNGTVEKGYQENIDCESLLLGIGCTGVVGYTGVVGCGQKGRFVRCKQVPVLLLPLACGVDPSSIDDEKVQPCK